MKKGMFIAASLVAMLGLTGCKTTAERLAAQQQADRSKCSSYGFQSGTESFATCMMRLDSVRQEEAAATRVIKKAQDCADAKRSARSSRGGFASGLVAGLNEGMACD